MDKLPRPTRPTREQLKSRPWSWIETHFPDFAKGMVFSKSVRSPSSLITPAPRKANVPRPIQQYAQPRIIKVLQVASESSPGLYYDVYLYDNGRYTCTCRAFLMGRQNAGLNIFNRPPCKHIRSVQR